MSPNVGTFMASAETGTRCGADNFEPAGAKREADADRAAEILAVEAEPNKPS